MKPLIRSLLFLALASAVEAGNAPLTYDNYIPSHPVKDDVTYGTGRTFTIGSGGKFHWNTQAVFEGDAQAFRDAIGIPSSSFNGSYNSLTYKPTLGTAAALNVPAIPASNAAPTEVVRGDDPRLADNRLPPNTTVAAGNYGDTTHIPVLTIGQDGRVTAAGTATVSAPGTGDFSTNTSVSVDGEAMEFQGTLGKTGRRSTKTGIIWENTGLRGTVTASSPLAFSGGTLSIPLATNSVDGYLSAADRTAFNAKQAHSTALDNVTGTNTGDQTITLTGDVTGSGNGSFAATIAANAVTNAKSAQMATKTYKGRTSSGTGNSEDVAVATLKADMGLGNVDNTADTAKPVSTAQQTALDLKAPLASPAFTGTPTGITKTHVGLGSVDNTADTAKPVSTAQQTALDLKAPLASPAFTGTPTGITKTHVGLGSVDNTADTAKPVSTAQQTALDLKSNAASPSFTGTKADAAGLVITPVTLATSHQLKTSGAADNRESNSGAVTLTLDNNTPTNGARFPATLTNSAGTAQLYTLPGVTVYSTNHGTTVTTFWLGAGNTEHLYWEYDQANSRFVVDGIPTPGYSTEFAQTAASTTDLWQPSLNQTVTGTTAITSFGSNAPAGTPVNLRFLAATPITYNSTSMIVPGSASITAAVGDHAVAFALGSGNWQIIKYTKRDGTALVSSGSGLGDPGANGIVYRSASNTTNAAKADQIEAALFAADAGASDTYTATLSPAITAYVTGNHYRFKANTANTGAASINFNSLGAKTVVKVAGGIATTLADNDILAGQWVDLVYDGTNMQMQSTLGNAASGGAVSSVATGQGFGTVSPTTGAAIVNFPVQGEQIVRSATAPISGTTWSYQNVSSWFTVRDSSTVSAVAGATTNPPGLKYTTAAATSGRVAGVYGSTINYYAQYPTFITRVSLDSFAAGNFYAYAGLDFYDPSSYGATPAGDVVMFIYHAGTDTNWQCYTNDNVGNGTATDSGVAVSAAPVVLKIVTSSGHVKFYINGTLVVDKTTRLPTSTVTPSSQVQVVSTAAETKTVTIYNLVEITP